MELPDPSLSDLLTQDKKGTDAMCQRLKLRSNLARRLTTYVLYAHEPAVARRLCEIRRTALANDLALIVSDVAALDSPAG